MEGTVSDMNNDTSISDLAVTVMQTLHDGLGDREPAAVFLVLDNECAVTNLSHDPYLALADLDISRSVIASANAIGVSAYGWAAPFRDSDGAAVEPSQSPDRRRVHLVSLITRELATASAITFLDTGEVTTDEEDSATGSLADALRDAASRVFSVDEDRGS